MTKLKTVMHQLHYPRRKARKILRSIKRSKYLYHIVFLGDKPGEGTNVGRGLLNND